MGKTKYVSRLRQRAALSEEMCYNGKSQNSLLAGSNKYNLVLHSSAFNCLRDQHFLTSNLTYCCAALCSFTEQKIK